MMKRSNRVLITDQHQTLVGHDPQRCYRSSSEPHVVRSFCVQQPKKKRKGERFQLVFLLLLSAIAFAAYWLMLIQESTWTLSETNKNNINRPNDLLPSLADTRYTRFPSIEDRVKLYMGAWYLPPPAPECRARWFRTISDNINNSNDTINITSVTNYSGNGNHLHQQHVCSELFHSEFSRTQLFFARQDRFVDCDDGERDTRLRRECADVQRTIDLKWMMTTTMMMMEQMISANSTVDDHDTNDISVVSSRPPILLKFGDRHNTSCFPSLQGQRVSMSPLQLEQLTTFNRTTSSSCQNNNNDPRVRLPIIWLLNTPRHFGPLNQVVLFDRLWEDKLPVAVFRGHLTGPDALDRIRSVNDHETCLRYPRCRLVLLQSKNSNKTLVDAKLTSVADVLQNSTIQGVELVGNKMPMSDLLRYKALIFLQGNDVSSGLKWGLLSRSVVLMPKPTMTAWTMEELLEPWVHYVPLDDDLNNVPKQVRWILDHDQEAQEIAHRSSLWIQDLMLHPDAASDNQKVMDEILERYRQHFAPQ